MKFHYVAVPELLDAPHMKRIQEEDGRLCQLVQDLTLQETVKKAEKELKTSLMLSGVGDIFTDSMQPVWKRGIVSICSVFAARLLLDIHQILPDFNGARLLHDEGHRQDELFEFNHDTLENRSGMYWDAKHKDLVMGIIGRIHHQMLEPKLPVVKQMSLESLSNQNDEDESLITAEELNNIPPNRIIHATIGAR
jgi:hypothetical protein